MCNRLIISKNLDLFKASTPPSRKADYYFGGIDSSVFIDFNRTRDNLISLVRIYFDGYKCCNFDNNGLNLN